MLNLTKSEQGDKLVVELDGRLDSMTAGSFKSDLTESLPGITELTLDFDRLEYVSSAGLSVLLTAQKTMMRQGSMKLVNVNDAVMDILDVTGFSDILTIE